MALLFPAADNLTTCPSPDDKQVAAKSEDEHERPVNDIVRASCPPQALCFPYTTVVLSRCAPPCHRVLIPLHFQVSFVLFKASCLPPRFDMSRMREFPLLQE